MNPLFTIRPDNLRKTSRLVCKDRIPPANLICWGEILLRLFVRGRLKCKPIEINSARDTNGLNSSRAVLLAFVTSVLTMQLCRSSGH